MAPISAEKALDQLCAAAGNQAEVPLMLLKKLLGNIKEQPGEPKFRKVNLENPRIKKDLMGYAGATEFLAAAGFSRGSAAGTVELSDGAGVSLNDALSVLLRRFQKMSDEKQREAIGGGEAEEASRFYKLSVEGGAHGAGLQEAQSLAGTAEGLEALTTLEKVLINVRRFPDSQQYKTVNLSKKAGKKLLPALPLLRLAGFEVRKDATSGEELAELGRVADDVVERIWALTWWAVNPAFKEVTLPPVTGVMAHALGALLGAAVGDALGAPLEGLDRMPLTAKEVDKAMEMCGGGAKQVAAGQVTDDTELMLCLADSLAANGASKTFPSDTVARSYGEWAMSRPFDIGVATRNAFGRMSSASDMARRAMCNNADSDTNGTLSRCTPLAVWGVAYGLSPPAFADVARSDAQLSHPNYVVTDATAAYVLAAAHLIGSGGDRAGALRGVDMWAEEERKRQLGSGDEFKGWMADAIGTADLPFGPNIHSARIGFTHAFRHLQKGSNFEQAMRYTLAGGGDTGSNAAIVGGLIGAAVGVQGIPERWIRAVMACNTDDGHPRPGQYHPKRLPELLQQMMATGSE
eukprot:TRINITY_DN57878_c0_g1_i1.p1 TRINITY_DN57878_c0_g1~~TRINITY_DN57878_c0_g1_i1.p1  ORF type:complete len:577 (+),score=109.58 TRINITY_DN57878_c0_g1_i1:110-1840(+)